MLLLAGKKVDKKKFEDTWKFIFGNWDPKSYQSVVAHFIEFGNKGPYSTEDLYITFAASIMFSDRYNVKDLNLDELVPKSETHDRLVEFAKTISSRYPDFNLQLIKVAIDKDQPELAVQLSTYSDKPRNSGLMVEWARDRGLAELSKEFQKRTSRL